MGKKKIDMAGILSRKTAKTNMHGMRRPQQRGRRCAPVCASRSIRGDADAVTGAALSRRRAAGMFLATTTTGILLSFSNSTPPAVAEEFEITTDGSAPMSQLNEYESLLKMAGEKPQVTVKEEVRKFVPSAGKPKGEEKPQTEAERMRAMSVSTQSTPKKPRASPAKTKKEKKSSSGGAGLPLPAVFAVAAAGIGGLYLSQKKPEESAPTKTAPAAPAPVQASSEPEPTPIAETPPQPTSAKPANAVEAAEWIARWRAKSA